MDKQVYNFSAGPACLAKPVLLAVKDAALDYNETGISLLAMSHRSKPVVDLFDETTDRLISLLNIPDNYRILWLQGGASLQFSMVPMNLLNKNEIADYVDTGAWSSKALKEAKNFGSVNVAGSSENNNYIFIPMDLEQNPDSVYLHITTNNTIYGTQYHVTPEIINKDGFLVADMSSDILSMPINVAEFGLIYAGAQKNMGPAGVTLVIIREDLIGRAERRIPMMLDYATHVSKESMFNTPPVFAVFMVNETLKWMESIGGVNAMAEKNRIKAKKLYDEIERNTIFISPVNPGDRSLMNVPFIFARDDLDENEFLSFCNERNLVSLKGHRSVGGFRASIYNAMPETGLDALITAMQEYEQNHKS
ncbi:MAG: 3-phosphoserine/phosphohydroxythreonine transaminase [Candidatus Neomarinimicrobiota bacterium]|nr:3-phosphoserine/phosphohydroxythreonine transaminase [Candidatus Neomarinimicrobiota bacterium]